MFTGLIQTTGTVMSINPGGATTRIVVAAAELAGYWKVGDSIAVNGVCLTAVDLQAEEDQHPGRFAAELAEETIQRTTLSRLQPGDAVNLELPTVVGSRLGGHVVQGHVDGTGKLISLVPLRPDLDKTDWRMTIELPETLAAHVIPQGSITIDGISLTVAALNGQRVEIAVIPHTYRSTNLRTLLSGAEVNIETDVLSKYAARRASFSAAAADSVLDDIMPPAPQHELARPTLVSTSSNPYPHITPAPLGEKEWLSPEYLLANGY